MPRTSREHRGKGERFAEWSSQENPSRPTSQTAKKVNYSSNNTESIAAVSGTARAMCSREIPAPQLQGSSRPSKAPNGLPASACRTTPDRARNQTNGPWHIIPTAPRSPERPAGGRSLSSTVLPLVSPHLLPPPSQSCPQRFSFIFHLCAQRLLFHGCCCRLCYSPSIGSSAGLWPLLDPLL
ncbi:hypothetical protein VTN96DRAFT_2422 [Rasamsonia emersonii]